MGIKDTIVNALDADKDGSVSPAEVAKAAADRVAETKDALVEAAGHVAAGFDADGDGKVSLSEVKAVADAAAGKAAGVIEAGSNKVMDAMDAINAKLP